MSTDWLRDGPPDAAVSFVFAHGAGAPMDSPFMENVAKGLGARGVRVVRFEFPYMAARRTGKKGPPDRMPTLVASFRAVVDALRAEGAARVAVGGKSMGGRVASHLADDVDAAALVAFGYPFRPPGKTAWRPVAHLTAMRAPMLIVQGTRDPFGGREELAESPLSTNIAWMEDGDHDFAPRKRSGRTTEQNWAEAIDRAAAFLRAQGAAG